MEQLLDDELDRLPFEEYSRVFNPSMPVEFTHFFVGREDELFRLRKAISRGGQHAVVFGERGIGKTCLTEIGLRDRSEHVIKLQCSNTWTFPDFSRQLLKRLGKEFRTTAVETLKEDVTSPGISVGIAKLGGDRKRSVKATERGIADEEWNASSLINELWESFPPTIVVLDEYDLLPKQSTFHKQLSMLLKGASNHPTELPITFIVVGIAATADELLAGHKSSGRNLEEVFLHYISRDKMTLFLKKSALVLGITFDAPVLNCLVNSSFGFPYYTHLVCESILDAIIIAEPSRRVINDEFYKLGVSRAVEGKYRGLKDAYVPPLLTAAPFTKTFLRWVCLYHDRGIRETDQLEEVLIRDSRLNREEYGKAVNAINNSRFPIRVGPKYVSIHDPMFLPFLKKYFWQNNPPDVEGPEQGTLF